MSEWEIEYWQSGKDKVSTISQQTMLQLVMLIKSKTSITLKILKVFGHISTIHIVLLRKKLWL